MFRKSYKVEKVVGNWIFLESEGDCMCGFDRTQVTHFYKNNTEEGRCSVTLVNNHHFTIEITLEKLVELLQLN